METNVGWKDAVNPKKISLINKYIDFNKKSKILDIGAGAGWYSKYLSDKGMDVTAIDKTPRFQGENIKIIHSNLEKEINLESNQFDYILAWDIIEHVANEKKLIEEIYRVSKKDAIILTSVPNEDDSRISDSYLTYCHFKDKTHKREYTLKKFEQLMTVNDFEKINIFLNGGSSYPYMILNFIDNNFFSFFMKVFIKTLVIFKIVQVKDCHGDIFGVFKK